MTRKRWIVVSGLVVALVAARLLMESRKGISMRMTAVEKVFVNSAGHAAEVADHAETLVAKIEVQPGWRYLDAGCGVGSAARRIAERRPLEVVGVDIDADLIIADA